MWIKSPFHSKTSALCESYRWKNWSGYYAVCSYHSCHEREYQAFRQAVGMIDVTPLFKYEVYGPGAAAFLSRVMVKNVEKLQLHQVAYTCWCDDDGKVVDDGTVSRLEDDYFRVTAAEPTLAWLEKYSKEYDVTIRDSSYEIAALALQGPQSRGLLKSVTDIDMDSLKFFRLSRGKLEGIPVTVSRTGYTGDLGYEVWVENKDAEALWDHLSRAGKSFGLEPAGLDAMDVTRIEAGFIMNGVDYYSANHCLIESRKSTPYEIGLGWTVNLKRGIFNGKAALQREKLEGPKTKFVGLEIDWDELEALYAEHDLPPELPLAAWRTAVPVYDEGLKQVGYASSGAWSPILKKNLALAHIDQKYAEPGQELQFEVTVEFQRKTVKATVGNPPFYNPPRKRE